MTRRGRRLPIVGAALLVVFSAACTCDCDTDAGPVVVSAPEPETPTVADPPDTSTVDTAGESVEPEADPPATEPEPVPEPDGLTDKVGRALPTGRGSTPAFTEPFDEPESLDRFRWQFHHGVSFEQENFAWQGDHDDSCGKPTTTRDIEVSRDIVSFPDGMGDLERYGNFVYWCAPGGDGTGHVMTSFNTDGYAQIGFSPDMSFDDVTSICWDQNHTDLGPRKWTQVVIVSEVEFADNDERLDYVSPEFFDGPGQGGVELGDDVVLFAMTQGSTVLNFGPDNTVADFDGFTTLDKARRFRTCLTDTGRGTIEIELERESDTEMRTFDGAFPDGPVRVIFQDDSYNPPKQPGAVDHPFTWHWDNIVVETE